MVVAGLGFPIQSRRGRAQLPGWLEERLDAAVDTAEVADLGWRGEVALAPRAAGDNWQEGPTVGASGFLS